MKTYWFGTNWKNFVRFHVNEKSLDFAKDKLRNFIAPYNLEGVSFLDIGCGSGIHSLAALNLGAAVVLSIDVDRESVNTSLMVRKKYGSSHFLNWDIRQASILDIDMLEKLPKFDVVYAWGSLHHTGQVWRAIKNATIPVKQNGILALALYSKDVTPEAAREFWLEKKKRYVTSGLAGRRYLEIWYIWKFLMQKDPRKVGTVFKRIKEHKRNRGMNLLVDIRDWLGGWPMEFVGDREVIEFVEEIGFKTIKVVTGEANTEFVFARQS